MLHGITYTKLAVPVEWLPSLCQHPNHLLRMVSNTRMFPTFMAPPTVAPCSLYNTKWDTYEWSFSYYKRFVIKVLQYSTIVHSASVMSYSRWFCTILTTVLMQFTINCPHAWDYLSSAIKPTMTYNAICSNIICCSTQFLQRCMYIPTLTTVISLKQLTALA